MRAATATAAPRKPRRRCPSRASIPSRRRPIWQRLHALPLSLPPRSAGAGPSSSVSIRLCGVAKFEPLASPVCPEAAGVREGVQRRSVAEQVAQAKMELHAVGRWCGGGHSFTHKQAHGRSVGRSVVVGRRGRKAGRESMCGIPLRQSLPLLFSQGGRQKTREASSRSRPPFSQVQESIRLSLSLAHLVSASKPTCLPRCPIPFSRPSSTLTRRHPSLKRGTAMASSLRPVLDGGPPLPQLQDRQVGRRARLLGRQAAARQIAPSSCITFASAAVITRKNKQMWPCLAHRRLQ